MPNRSFNKVNTSAHVKIGFIGAGTVGNALAVWLSRKNYPVVAVASRTKASADRLAARVAGCHAYKNKQSVVNKAELIFITTPDDAIAEVAAELKWRSGQYVVHCSGADSVSSLKPAQQAGAQVGGFHPLQTFANIDYAIKNLPGSTFALESDGELLETLKQIATDLDGNWIKLDSQDKTLYHAAAVIACNYLVTLVKLSADLWETFGATSKESIQALTPLLRGTLNNIENVGLPKCLTGPIARGDLGTIKKHLSVLEKSAPEIFSAYCELGRHTIPIARAKGTIDGNRAEEIHKLLTVKVGQSD